MEVIYLSPSPKFSCGNTTNFLLRNIPNGEVACDEYARAKMSCSAVILRFPCVSVPVRISIVPLCRVAYGEEYMWVIGPLPYCASVPVQYEGPSPGQSLLLKTIDPYNRILALER